MRCAGNRGRAGRLSARQLSLLVAGAGFLLLYLVPFLKYPANPPAVGNDATIAQRLEMFRKQKAVLEARMAELQQTMDTLDYKCWFYETAKARGTTDGISDLPDADLPENLRPVREHLREVAE